MRIWIVENDEKRGPFEIYELRDRIERGELDGEELAWHQDLDGWVPLRELDVFQSEFALRPAEEAPASLAAPPPLPKRPQPFLRFLARAFDLALYSLVLWGGMKLLRQDLLAAALSPLFNILSMLPFFVFEAGLVHLWATTPGKALLGIRVRSATGGHLAIGPSILRALRVYIIGLGLMQPLLTLLCGGFSLWFTLRNGVAPWDAVGKNRIQVDGPTTTTLVVFVLSFSLLLGLLCFGILLPLAIELQETYPNGVPTAAANQPAVLALLGGEATESPA